jgi:hypothetical protein
MKKVEPKHEPDPALMQRRTVPVAWREVQQNVLKTHTRVSFLNGRFAPRVTRWVWSKLILISYRRKKKRENSGHFCKFQKNTDQSKQPPIGQTIAESGHPVCTNKVLVTCRRVIFSCYKGPSEKMAFRYSTHVVSGYWRALHRLHSTETEDETIL